MSLADILYLSNYSSKFLLCGTEELQKMKLNN